MQVSAISDDYGQNIKALKINQNNNENACINGISYQTLLDKQFNKKENDIKDSIQEWKKFCHQQILKGNLNIIA